MNTKIKSLIGLSVVLTLSGCGGGGGSSAAVTQTTFTDWSSISKPTQVNLEGISTDISYTAASKINAITNKGTDLTTTASVSYRTDNTISKVEFSTQNGTVTFNEDGTDIIGDTGAVLYGYNQAGSDFFLAADPLDSNVNWNYQTFGMWETGRGTGSGTAGGISVGSATVGSNIPTSGSATYSGYFGGALSDFDGDDFLTKGDVSVAANFATRSLVFSTDSTQYVSPVASSPSWISGNSFDMDGTLTYSAATNSFTGTVIDGNSISGTATGKFYGPNAEELGGVYNLSGSGLNLHAGAFGAKK
jgi:hypothetical protein